MSMRHVGIVLRKELRDMFRDRKAIVSSLLVPIVLMPLLFFVMGLFMNNIDAADENIVIALTHNAAAVQAYLRDEVLADMPGVQLIADPDPEDALRKERASVLLDVPGDAQALIAAGKPLPVTLVNDPDKTKSMSALGRVQRVINAYADATLDEKLRGMGVDVQQLRPLIASSMGIDEYAGVERKAGGGGFMLAMLVPMLIPMLIAVGGSASATDLVAGEKERRTLEPLLSTKGSRLSILMGKFLTVTIFAVLSMFASLIGYAIGFSVNPSSMLSVGHSGGLVLPWLPTVLALGIVLFLGMTFAGIELMLSTYARSFKEAQTYVGYVTILAMLPAYATMMMQAGDIKAVYMLLPVVNAAAGLKMVLGGVIHLPLLLIGLGASVAWSALALYLTSRMFRKESVLFRS